MLSRILSSRWPKSKSSHLSTPTLISISLSRTRLGSPKLMMRVPLSSRSWTTRRRPSKSSSRKIRRAHRLQTSSEASILTWNQWRTSFQISRVLSYSSSVTSRKSKGPTRSSSFSPRPSSSCRSKWLITRKSWPNSCRTRSRSKVLIKPTSWTKSLETTLRSKIRAIKWTNKIKMWSKR